MVTSLAHELSEMLEAKAVVEPFPHPSFNRPEVHFHRIVTPAIARFDQFVTVPPRLDNADLISAIEIEFTHERIDPRLRLVGQRLGFPLVADIANVGAPTFVKNPVLHNASFLS